MGIEITVKDVRVTIDARNIDKTPIHRAMAEAYLKEVRATFGPNGQNRQAEWPSLSESYIERLKKARYTPGSRVFVPTLFRSGKLFRGIRMEADSDSGRVISRGLPYSAIHQRGNPSKNLPRRPFFPADEAGNPTPRIVKIVTDAAVKAAKFK